jgi:Ca-activated chloride channel family protein
MRRVTILWAVCLLATAGCTNAESGANAQGDGGMAGDGGHIQWDGGGGYSQGDGGYSSADAGSAGSNINLGGAEDFGYFRRLVENGIVPNVDDFDAAGFFAEHYTELPPPDCGTRVCLQAMLGVMADLLEGRNLTVLQLGLNTPITLDPDARPPLSLAVVVDRSGSMAEAGKIEYVRLGLQTLIGALEDTDEMALITYADTARVDVPMASLATHRSQLLAVAGSLTANGSTNLYAALELGYQQVVAVTNQERQARVILLSDGMPTAGITSETQILAMSAGYNREGRAITTVGLGTDFNAPLMRGLAEQGNGNHYFLEDTSAIEDVFTEELAYFTVPVAFDVSLKLGAGSSYAPVRAYGSSFWQTTADGGHLEIPSVFIAHRISSGDVSPSGGRRGGGSALLVQLAPRDPLPPQAGDGADVATIDVSYREPGATELTSAQVVVRYPYSPDTLLPQGHFAAANPAIIKKSFVMLNLYQAIERACARFHAGDGTAAIGLLDRAIAAANDYDLTANGGAGDPDMTADVELLQQLIAVMELNGAVPPATVDIPDDPWPAD